MTTSQQYHKRCSAWNVVSKTTLEKSIELLKKKESDLVNVLENILNSSPIEKPLLYFGDFFDEYYLLPKDKILFENINQTLIPHPVAVQWNTELEKVR
jgi:hypothetical protein